MIEWSGRPAMFVAAVGISLLAHHDAAAQQNRRAREASRDGRSRIDTTVAIDKGGVVSVAARSGDVIVTAGNTGQVQIRSEGDASYRVTAARTVVEISPVRGGDGRLEVRVPLGTRVVAQSQSGDVSVRGTRGEVDITAPSGDVTVEEASGRVDVRAFSGDVRLTDIGGAIDVRTTSGDLDISDVHGDVEVANTSGDVQLRDISGRNVRAKTTSGTVSFDGTINPEGRYEFSSHSGEVRVRVQRDVNAQFAVSTWNGEIHSDFPITLMPGQRAFTGGTSRQITFTVGGGAARIAAESFNGDVTIARRP